MTDVSYRIDGPADAPPLVLGNSIGTTAELWDGQMAAFTRQFRVIRYEHRGHGGTPAPPGPYTVDDLGTDVLDLLDGLGVHRASFAGISLGAMVAMWIASNQPARVERLALCCTSAGLGRPDDWATRAALVRSEGMAAVTEVVLDRWLTPAFRAAHPDVVAQLVKTFESVDPEGYAGCCEAIGTMDQLPTIGAITAPTLVLAGAADPATPPVHAEAIHERIAGSTLVVLDDAAHLAHLDQPAAFSEAVLEHLGSP
jgi:3-oxoadipate enol-lactonase